MNCRTYKRYFLVAVVTLFLVSVSAFAQTGPLPETAEEKAKRGEALFHEASDLYKQNTPASLAAAAAKFGESNVIFQQLGDKNREGFCLTWLGGVSIRLGAKRVALNYFKQALVIYQSLPDRIAEAEVHFGTGRLYRELDEPKSALEHYEAALKIYSAAGMKGDEIDLLKIIGKVHLELGDVPKAISFNEQALVLARSSGDRKREIEVLSNTGSLHLIERDGQKALISFQEMLGVARREKDTRAESEALDLIATANRLKNDPVGMKRALETALKLARDQGDKKAEAKALNDLAEVDLRLDDLEAALMHAEDSLAKSTAAGDKKGEAAALLNIGIAHARQEKNDLALTELKKAAGILESEGDPEQLALARMMIGGVYAERGDKQKGIEATMAALAIAKANNLTELQAEVGNNIGSVLLEMGDHARALEYFREALPLAAKLGLTETEARIQLNISNALRAAGKGSEAIESLERAEAAAKASGDRITTIKSIVNKGGIYLDLGENEKAMGSYMEAMFMVIERLPEARNEEVTIYTELFSTILNNLGRVFQEMGALRSALDHYSRSLPLLKDLKDRDRQAITLTNMADIYSELGDKEKAVDSLNQAMAIVKETGNVGHEATILNSYGLMYSDQGVTEKSVENYGRSLFLLKYVADPRREATTLANLMVAYAKARHARAAILYGKLAANKLQSLRANIRKFDRQTQKTYLTKVESTYRELAELLVAEGRLTEAQQVLNAFKDQQAFDDGAESANQLKPITLTPHEGEISGRLDTSAVVAGTVAGAEKDAALKTSAENFAKTLQEIERDLTGTSEASDEIGDVADALDMRAVLTELERSTHQKAAAVYVLVGDDKLSAIIVSTDRMSSVSVPIKRSALEAKAKTMWALLQSDSYDPRTLGKELYDIVFKPIEAELPVGTGSILWSLDGSLRYIPMAALFDGKQYLVERYRHINFTRADRERLIGPVKAKWTATAFGTSKEHTVDLLGTVKSFASLPGVTEELGMLVTRPKRRGIFGGEVYQDEKFTRAAMIEALKAKRPLVHISTHFSFRPGDDTRSFLLLGDGAPFTLADMKKQKDMFAGVELLTLSACNTAAQQADANGREVDAFFELAQRLGAQSVLATLWPVADNSTPWLMREFYDLKVNKRQNKAEALRNAQLALLNGSAKTSRSATRSEASQVKIVVEEDVTSSGTTPSAATRAETFTIPKKDAKPFILDPKRPFAHPFYWSPFILIGNWR